MVEIEVRANHGTHSQPERRDLAGRYRSLAVNVPATVCP
jgi:hypothetical protein